MSEQVIERYSQRIRAATGERPLRLRGGGSKDFYGNHLNSAQGEILDTR